MSRLCTVEGCGKPHNAKGLCLTHYHRQRVKDGHRKPVTCREEGCERRRWKEGLCVAHHARASGLVDASLPIRERPRGYKVQKRGPGVVCRITGCGRPVKSSGLCATHQTRRSMTPAEWSHPVGTPRGAKQDGRLVRLGRTMWMRPEVAAAIEAEALERHMRPIAVLRTWLDAELARRQEDARRAEWERMEFGRQKPDPKPRAHNDEGSDAPDAVRVRNARIREVLQREALTAEQVAERFGVSLENAQQLLTRARKAAS